MCPQVDLALMAQEVIWMAGLGKNEPAGLLADCETVLAYLAEVPQLVGHADGLVGLSDDLFVVESHADE